MVVCSLLCEAVSEPQDLFPNILETKDMAVDQYPRLPKSQRAIKVVGASSICLEEDIPLPPVEDEDVLVRVHAVALNPFDW